MYNRLDYCHLEDDMSLSNVNVVIYQVKDFAFECWLSEEKLTKSSFNQTHIPLLKEVLRVAFL